MRASTANKKTAKKPKLRIRTGDTVKVIAGGEKGKTGKVLKVDAKTMRVLVDGVNIRSKHVKPTAQSPQGGITEKALPIAYSNVMLVDGKGNPTRVRMEVTKKGGKTVRIRHAKTTGEVIATPAMAK